MVAVKISITDVVVFMVIAVALIEAVLMLVLVIQRKARKEVLGD